MNTIAETTGTKGSTRKGLHRFFHTSRLDFYVCGVIAIALFTFAVLEALDPEQLLASLSVAAATQIALLFLIFGVLADAHYRTFEAHYDK